MPLEAGRSLARREVRAVSSSGLETALAKARATLISGGLKNEEHVKLAVIRPLLMALGWDATDSRQWIPEMIVPNGKVDEALL